MARWLVKTEPNDYSFEDLQQVEKDVWDGVKNNLALKNMREMKPGDDVFVYHTGRVRAIIGIARVVSDPYPDPQSDDEKITVVDVAAVRPLARPVTLKEIKQDDAFADWELVRISRLSVMPVPDALWERVLLLASE